MADTEDMQERLIHEGEGETDRWLPVNIKQQILCAIANIEYGSVEVVIHDSRVVQIACRKKSAWPATNLEAKKHRQIHHPES